MSTKTIFVQPGGGYDNVVVGSSEVRAPAGGEITVRLHANSLNYHDFAVVSGMWGPTEQRSPMADGAGEVIAVGPDVTEFKVGDSVVSTFFPEWIDGTPLVEGFVTVPGDGIDGYAREQVTAKATSFTLAPTGWSHAEAATLTTAGLTAWRALMADDSLKPGDTVLIQGTGGVSIFALQFAKMAGATVIATSSRDEKLERLKAMGADHVINYREERFEGVVRKLTAKKGVDVVFEHVGVDTWAGSMLSMKRGGRLVTCGSTSGIATQINLMQLFQQQLRLIGSFGCRMQNLVDAMDKMARGIVRPVIDPQVELDGIDTALARMEGRDVFGKIIVRIS